MTDAQSQSGKEKQYGVGENNEDTAEEEYLNVVPEGKKAECT